MTGARRLPRWLRRAFALVLRLPLTLLVLLAVALAWTLPPFEDAAVPGLSAPVRIALDRDAVPRVRAATMEDAAAALGWLHARERLFQMELMRRGTSGRLSEIAGPATLRIDRLMRTLGVARAAEAALAGLSPEARAVFEAYARGVNAWIAQRGRLAAPEFVLLGEPEPWRPVDSLLWGKMMGLALGGNWRTELRRLWLAQELPPARLRELWPADGQAGRPEAALPFPGPLAPFASASNIWAVDGRHSATGAPLLASDPHLAYGLPGPFYLARLEVGDRVIAGATAPGVPLVLIGHNGRVAWGFTTTGADTEDLFVERLTADGRYETPDGPRAFVTREEIIRVRGAEPHRLLVRETRHGPVISDVEKAPRVPGTVLAVAMASLAPGDTAADGLLALVRAGTLEEARAAATKITVPVQNLVVADRERIGLFVTGRVPLRRAGDGALPVPGHDGSHDWTGFAEGEALPRIVAPASGRIVNANERVAPADFPVFLARDWPGDWRARRIRQMLDARPRHEPADFAAMQADVQSLLAADLLPVMTRIPAPEDPDDAEMFDRMRRWDGAMRPDAPEPLLFKAWLRAFVATVLERGGVESGVGETTGEFAAFVLGPGARDWCDGDCAPMLAEALRTAMADLEQRRAVPLRDQTWGRVHRATFAHPLLRFIPLAGWLSSVTIPVGGDFYTVNRQAFGEDFAAIHGASFRAVFDLADLARTTFVIAPGQSGHPFSPHRADFLERWRANRQVTLGPAGEGERVARLTPAD